MGGSRSQWEGVYAHKAETEVSWYQSHSVRSLELIEATSFDHSASVIDVGGCYVNGKRMRIAAYVAALTRGTRAGSSVIIATFALDGPEKCTRLPVQRYNPSLLANRLGANFKLVSASAERHVTPSGNEQSFTYSVFEQLKSI